MSFNVSEANKARAAEKVMEIALKMLDKGIVPWKKAWHCSPSSEKAVKFGNKNISGKFYTQGNRIITEMFRFAYGYESRVFMTKSYLHKEINGEEWNEELKSYVKVKDTGMHAKYHGKMCPISFYEPYQKKDPITKEPLYTERNGIKVPVMGSVFKLYYVINTDQIEFDKGSMDFSKYQPQEPSFEPKTDDPIGEIESDLLARYKDHPRISRGGDEAYYTEFADYVRVPLERDHDSSDEYISTLAHELTHSTGIKSKNNRKCFEDYARNRDAHCLEEMVAEFGASMVCGYYGIERTFDNSASYIAGWSKSIKNNERCFFDAINMASKAFDYMMGTVEEEEVTED